MVCLSIAWVGRNTIGVKKSNLQYTLAITEKCVTSGGSHLRGLAPGQHNLKERRSGGELATLCLM